MHPLLESAMTSTEATGRTPFAILDVDLTIVDNAPRTRAIFADWLHSVRGRLEGAGDKAIEALTMPIVFGVQDNLRALGVNDPDMQREALGFWLRAFFSSEYCRRDVAIPGAVDAVRRLHELGITIAYLTARTASMAEGTVASFATFGLPVCVPGTVLIMKEDPKENDQRYKERALRWIGELGAPVLCADNEPGHANAMHRAFPEALTVLVGDRHSARAPEPAAGVVKLARLSNTIHDEDG